MERVGLFGYFGHGNLGDEALRLTWERALERDFSVISSSPPWLPLAPVPWIFCGGILQDRTSLRSLLFYLTAVRLARGPVALASVGVDLARGISRGLVRRTLRCADYVSVRDEPSRVTLDDAGIHAVLHPDPVLSWPPPPRRDGEEIIVNLVPVLDRGVARAAISRAMWLGRRLGASVRGLAMSREDTGPLRGLPVLVPRGPGEALRLLSRARLVVGARLHILELALVAGVPFVALPYASKVEGFLRLVERDLPAPVPRGPAEWEGVLGSEWGEALARARSRLREEAREGIQDVRRWLHGMA